MSVQHGQAPRPLQLIVLRRLTLTPVPPLPDRQWRHHRRVLPVHRHRAHNLA
jgi:hypothetical protein